MYKQPLPAPTAGAVGHCPTPIRISRTCRHWLVGCFGFYGPLRQYFSLYRAISQRERERERERERGGGLVVLGKLPVPGHPTILITVGQGPTALAAGTGGGCLNNFLSSIPSLFILPLFGRRPDID